MIFNVKSVSLTILGLVTFITSQDLPFCKTEDIRVRKNIKDLSDDQLERYFGAVKKLNSAPRPNVWDNFTRMHVDYFPQVHNTQFFLVWHRYFLYFMEKELQKIDPSVTIPYWDWTVDSEEPNNDSIYSDKYFGKVNGNDRCINSGPFKDFKVLDLYSPNGDEICLRRNKIFTQQVTGGPEMENLYLNSAPIGQFSIDLEGVPHSRIHNGIGGDFATGVSPSNPIFYSHHAFVDKLWFDYQMRYPETMDEYALNRRTPVAPWGFPVLQGIDTSDRLCYVYKQEHFSWTTQDISSRSAFIPDFTPEPYTVPSSVTTIEELVKHDVAFVTRNFELVDINIPKALVNNPSLLSSAPGEPPVKLIDVEFIAKMKLNYSNIRENELRELEFKNFMKEIGSVQ
ncbi:Di-copper centre-containing protein [Neoconidiobolus thromboides FSU 785]|nr:Di-copper centre-containing protein [Neoconidiobolus thromboides FSU 785]